MKWLKPSNLFGSFLSLLYTSTTVFGVHGAGDRSHDLYIGFKDLHASCPADGVTTYNTLLGNQPGCFEFDECHISYVDYYPYKISMHSFYVDGSDIECASESWDIIDRYLKKDPSERMTAATVHAHKKHEHEL